jgi:hypothetical protein
MARAEILSISFADESAALYGSYVDLPKVGHQFDSYSFVVAGWALSRSAPVNHIEVMYENYLLQQAPIRDARPDVGALYPDVHGADTCGFWIPIGVLGLAPEFTLAVEAVLDDGSRARIAEIRGLHLSLRSGYQPKLRPLMVTSMGRTGTTWLMRLLSEHPRIVAQRIHPYETRAANYWLHMLAVLSQQASREESLFPEGFLKNDVQVAHNPYFTTPYADDPEVHRWLGRDYPEALAAFCQRSIDEFYLRIASSQGQEQPTYFAEKYNAWIVPWLTSGLYHEGREIFLVRDFRDMMASIFAFDKKRGFSILGQDMKLENMAYIEELKDHALRLGEHWRRRSTQSYLLRYEDLIVRPKEKLEEIIGYLDLDASDPVIGGMIERASEETAESAAHRTTENALASIGRWTRDLTPDLQAACNEAFREPLRIFGYPLEGPYRTEGSSLSLTDHRP